MGKEVTAPTRTKVDSVFLGELISNEDRMDEDSDSPLGVLSKPGDSMRAFRRTQKEIEVEDRQIELEEQRRMEEAADGGDKIDESLLPVESTLLPKTKTRSTRKGRKAAGGGDRATKPVLGSKLPPKSKVRLLLKKKESSGDGDESGDEGIVPRDALKLPPKLKPRSIHKTKKVAVGGDWIDKEAGYESEDETIQSQITSKVASKLKPGSLRQTKYSQPVPSISSSSKNNALTKTVISIDSNDEEDEFDDRMRYPMNTIISIDSHLRQPQFRDRTNYPTKSSSYISPYSQDTQTGGQLSYGTAPHMPLDVYSRNVQAGFQELALQPATMSSNFYAQNEQGGQQMTYFTEPRSSTEPYSRQSQTRYRTLAPKGTTMSSDFHTHNSQGEDQMNYTKEHTTSLDPYPRQPEAGDQMKNLTSYAGFYIQGEKSGDRMGSCSLPTMAGSMGYGASNKDQSLSQYKPFNIGMADNSTSILESTTTQNVAPFNQAESESYNKHCPKKPRQDSIFDDGTKRIRAVRGCPDESLLTVILKATAKPDDEKYRPGHRALYYKYQQEVDWHSTSSIKKLNDWRDQLYRRNLPRVQKSYPFWIERERDELLYHAAQMLTSRSTIAWNRLANIYNTNNYVAGVEHRAGDKCVAENKSTAGNHLKRDRRAPWRTASALQKKSRTWPGFRDLIKDAFDASNPGDDHASDDAEMDDPEPEFRAASPGPMADNGSLKRKAGDSIAEDEESGKSIKKWRYTGDDDDDVEMDGYN